MHDEIVEPFLIVPKAKAKNVSEKKINVHYCKTNSFRSQSKMFGMCAHCTYVTENNVFPNL